MFGTGYDPNIFYVVRPDNENDVVVLTLTFFRLSHGGLPKDDYWLEDRADTFFFWQSWTNGKGW